MEVFDVHDLPDEVVGFVTERHLATLSIERSDRSPHVTPVGFTWDGERALVRVITRTGSVKSRLTSAGPTPVSICQVDGGRWLTIEGTASMTTAPDACAEGVSRYAERYRQPKDLPDRAVIEVEVTKVMGRA